MRIELPELCLVVLVGPTSSGKSTFAARHFLPTEVISSDTARALVSDDLHAMDATADAFDLVHHLAGVRLKRGRLTVIDATSVRPEDRVHLIRVARQQNCLCVAIVFDLPLDVMTDRHGQREDRPFPARIVRNHHRALRQGLRRIKREGFARVHVLDSEEAVDAVQIARTPLWNDRRELTGPFDLIGDIHGCGNELKSLLRKLGYEVDIAAATATHPEGRTLVFLGDLVDRGPDSIWPLRLAMNLVEAHAALCVPGNHEEKLKRWLEGRNVKVSHGLEQTIAQLEALDDPAFNERVKRFIDGLVSHLRLDGGKLVVAHAGLKEAYQGRASKRVRAFCLWGETTGETDAFGLPVRYAWADDYRGDATVVYGHTPVPSAHWVNNTICIDTGCVFGGKLSALRWPSKELVQVEAEHLWYEPVKPLVAPPDRAPTLLDFADVGGKQHLTTRFGRTIDLAADKSAAAFEVVCRFAADPRWLIHLPPTMSPCETAPAGTPLLERPAEAFAYYRDQGIDRVICQEKHMGSRALLLVCRSPEVAADRFGTEPGLGALLSRRGRRMFADPVLEHTLLDRSRAALEASGLWESLHTDWVLIDAELMPWTAKASELLRTQYGPVGAAGTALTQALSGWLAQTPEVEGLQPLRDRITARAADLAAFRDATRRYAPAAHGLDDLRLAPFHLLASEGKVHTDKSHPWHLATLATLAQADPALFLATPSLEVHLADAASEQAATDWWTARTDAGSEGMVVKPLDWLATGKNGLVQPAVKVRGPEYLRIIYGPEYRHPDQLEALRKRGLGRKRSLAMREFLLGLEGLARFVDGEPLYRVHPCAYGVLALEAEPVDPRL